MEVQVNDERQVSLSGGCRTTSSALLDMKMFSSLLLPVCRIECSKIEQTIVGHPVNIFSANSFEGINLNRSF